MLNLVTIVGVIGASLVLLGFVGNRLRWWSARDQMYVRINAVGSLVLIGYSYWIDSYPFVILNVVWLLFSLKDLFRSK
jgi:hypothetical protein